MSGESGQFEGAQGQARQSQYDDGGPSEDQRALWGLAGVALTAALLQLLASVLLGMARLNDFVAASTEGSGIYMLTAALVTAAAFSIYLVRERTPLALALALLWPLGLWFGLRQHTTTLGLAFHGEFILHHFSALLALALAVVVPLAWARDERLGSLPVRVAPAALAIPGALLLSAAHLAPLELAPFVAWTAERWVADLGAGLLLLAWPVAAGLFWTRLGPPVRRPIALVLLLPLVLRVAGAGIHGLSGELVDPAMIPWLGACMVVTSVVVLGLLRPRLALGVTALVGAICLAGSMLFYYFYEHGFGELEDGLGGLLQSLFGFQVPYPPYVEDLRSAALMMGLFFMFVTVYTALVSTEDRTRGISLGLMLIAGLGLSSPHLALMVGAGAMLFIETLLPGAPYRDLRPAGWSGQWPPRGYDDDDPGGGGGGGPSSDDPSSDDPLQDLVEIPAPDAGPHQVPSRTASTVDLRAILEGLALRLAVDAPTVAEDGGGLMISLRDELDDIPFEVRARVPAGSTSASGARVELTVGLPGLAEPSFELVPDAGERGHRPAHLLSRSHRVVGEPRQLEAFGDAPLDALTSFPKSYLRAFEAGAQVDLGGALEALHVDSLEALLRALIRAVATT